MELDKEEIVKLFIYGHITDAEHKQLIISLELKNKENYQKMKDKIEKYQENDLIEE